MKKSPNKERELMATEMEKVSLRAVGLDGKAPISWNMKEFEKNLNEFLEPFKSMSLDELSLPETRKAVAKIRKYEKQGEEVRIKVKNKLNEQYEKMALEYKPVHKNLQAEILRFSSHIQSAEKVEKENKKTEIVTFFNQNAKDLKSSILLDKILLKNDKWLNISYPMSKIHDELFATFGAIREAVESIRAFNSPFQTELIAHYHDTFKLGEVLVKKQRLEDMAAVEAEAAQRTKEQEIKNQAQNLKDREAIKGLAEKAEEVTRELKLKSPEPPEEKAEPSKPMVTPDIERLVKPIVKDVQGVTFTVFATDEKIMMLGKFCKDNDIRIEVKLD